MDVVLGVALRAALLIYSVAAPGWLWLRFTGFAGRSWIDRVLAAAASGAAIASVTVTVLLLAGVYFRSLLLALLLLVSGLLLWLWRRPTPIPDVPPAARRGLSPIDRAVVAASVLCLAVYLVDAWTSPLTWWDGLASWGKWAADWGGRTSSAHYVTGAYPQLVPRIASIMYKVTGAHAEVLPLDFFALHGFYVLFAAWFVLAAVRVAELVDVPAWPTVLAGLGSGQFREHAGAGTVDVLVSASILTVVALYLGLRRGEWRARRGTWLILGAAIVAAIFTKWTGALAVAFVLVLERVRMPASESGSAPPVGRRVLGRAILIGLAGVTPFLVEQGVAELRIHHWRPDPYEVNISARQMPTLLSTDVNVVYRGGDARERWSLVQLRFWNSYDVPASLRWLYTGFLLLCLAASVPAWFARAALPVIAIDAAIWLAWSSYDQRNLFGVLPMIALCATLGAQRLWTWRPPIVWRNAVALVAGVWLVLAGGSLLKDAQARVMKLAPHAVAARIEAIRGGTPAKVAAFYPTLTADYQYLAALSERTGARHVLVTSPLFRFFPRGSHALSFWPYELVETGDVFAAHEWHRPPADPRWVLVWRGQVHRVWIRCDALHDVTPRADAGAPPGERRLIYDVQPADGGMPGLIVWRAELRGGGGSSVIDADPGVQLDPVITSSICEPAGEEAIIVCSGVAALARGHVPIAPGALRVGVTTAAPSSAVALQVASWPPGPVKLREAGTAAPR